ncbi:MAG: SprB repeat-containing protein [Lewinellaceae bacterium]|nr:SprB repeat-containing protein [Lewinellaceae bacterium]
MRQNDFSRQQQVLIILLWSMATLLCAQSGPALQLYATDINCQNDTATISAVFDPQHVQFQGWTGPNGFFSNLPLAKTTIPGNYTASIVDTLLSTSTTLSIQVIQDTVKPVAVALAPTNFGCLGDLVTLDGSASSSGPNLRYQWTTLNGEIVGISDSLFVQVSVVATYTLVVKDTLNQCSDTASVFVTYYDTMSVFFEDIEPVQCFGGANGRALAVAHGGDGNYTYTWSNGGTTALQTNLSVGAHNVTVADGQGCTTIDSIYFTQPPPLFANASGGSNSTLLAAPSGGVSPYTLLWSNGDTSFQQTAVVPGNYTVTVSDALGCSNNESVTITASSCLLSAYLASSNISCYGINDGQITLTPLNATEPVTIKWSTGEDGLLLDQLGPGNYSVTISDASGCSQIHSTTIWGPQALAADFFVHQDQDCPNAFDAYLGSNASGGTPPYQYAWSNGAQTNLNLYLTTGPYTVTVSDSKGCTTTLSSSIIATDTIPPILLLNDASISLNNDGLALVYPSNVVQQGYDAQCDLAILLIEPNMFDCSDLGAHTITVTATDVSGNSRIRSCTVTVLDNVWPTFQCPPNVTIGLCEAVYQYDTPLVTDNCPVDQSQVIQVAGLPSGAVFAPGIHLQVFEYTDASGHTGV